MPTSTAKPVAKDRCGYAIPLPVVRAESASGPVRPSKMGKWRAAALIAVYVLMIAHFVQWRLAGRTVTPVEPSESMETLRTGAINAGAIFFAAALLATLLFGRFVCGWACHIVALQDLCGWALKKAGLRPRPFRSRLLVFAPLIAAGYMFLWPTAVRLWFGLPRPATTWHIVTNDFWATFPGPVIGALTFIICGFAIVWFLGNKGFCTYACPYGGFFGVLDKVSPVRIRVTDACNHCGHCSAVCTSNVRVAEEVRLFSMVVDPGCMKCMDCVSVCPNDALYVGWGRPALLAPRKQRKPLRYDGTWPEEFAMVGVFVAALFSLRGLYDSVPFLFSLGLAAITAFAALKTWQLFSRDNLTLHTIPLKRAGRIVRGGWTYAACFLLWSVFVAHSGFVKYQRWRGDRDFASVTPAVTGWPIATSIDPSIQPPERLAIKRARAHFAAADRWGLMRLSPISISLAWLDILDGHPADAEQRLRQVIAATPQNAAAHVALGEVLLKLGRLSEAEAEFRRALELNSAENGASFGLGLLSLKRGDPAAAASHLGRALDRSHQVTAELAELDAVADYYYAEALRQSGKQDESLEVELRPHGDPRIAIAVISRALSLEPNSSMLHRANAVESARLRDSATAAREIARALELDQANFNNWMHRGRLAMAVDDKAGALGAFSEAARIAPESWQAQAHLAAALTIAERFDEAIQHARNAVQAKPDSADVRATLGAALISKGNVPGALAEYREAVRLEPGNSEYQLRLAFLLAQTGQTSEALRVLNEVAQGPNAEARLAAEQMISQLRSAPGR